jgi:hypothetical protein
MHVELFKFLPLTSSNLFANLTYLLQSYSDLMESITGERDEAGYTFLQDALKVSSCSDIGIDRGSNSSSSRDGCTSSTTSCQHRGEDSSHADAGALRNGSSSHPHSIPDGAPLTSAALCGLSTEELLLRCQRSITEAELKFNGPSKDKGEEQGQGHSSTGSIPGVSPLSRKPEVAAEKGSPYSVRDGEIGNSRQYFGIPASLSGKSLKYLKATGRGVVVLVQLVTSTFRHLCLPRSKVASVMLLVRLSLASYDDEIILKRVLPCLLLALVDPASSVRALSVRALTAVLSAVGSISPFESDVFPQYLFAPLSVIARDGETPVRIAFAECLGELAETARRFLEKAHFMVMMQAIADASTSASEEGSGKGQGRAVSKAPPDPLNAAPATSPSGTVSKTAVRSGVHVEFPYDTKLKTLHDQVIRWIREVSSVSAGTGHSGGQKPAEAALNTSLTCASGGSLVRRVLLEDIGRLCVFFGQEATTDLLLTQILTFLNDQVRSNTL